MKKDYEIYANDNNTPHLQLYKMHTRLAHVLSSLNFLIMSVYSFAFINDNKIALANLFFAFAVFSEGRTITKNELKKNNNLSTVIGCWIFCIAATVVFMCRIKFWWLILAYFIEMLFVVIKTIMYFKAYNENRRKYFKTNKYFKSRKGKKNT